MIQTIVLANKLTKMLLNRLLWVLFILTLKVCFIFHRNCQLGSRLNPPPTFRSDLTLIKGGSADEEVSGDTPTLK